MSTEIEGAIPDGEIHQSTPLSRPLPPPDTSEEIVDIDDLLQAFNFDQTPESLNEDYAGISFAANAKVMKVIHGKAIGGTNINGNVVKSILITQDRLVSFDMIRTGGVWYDPTGAEITEMDSEIKKTLSKSVNSAVKVVYSGEYNRDAKPAESNKTLRESIGKYVLCHKYNKKEGKYTFIGKLKLVSSQIIHTNFNGYSIDQEVFYFA